ncbi:MAG: MATE family efflux transporter [Acidobacteriota bacterium]
MTRPPSDRPGSGAAHSTGSLPRRAIRLVREALAGGQRDFTTGNLNRAVVFLAIPMVMEMAMESVFAIVDAFFVTRLGSDALATVGLAESMLTIIYGLAVGVSMATTAMVARRIGEKRDEEASSVAIHAIVVGLGVAVGLGVPGFLAAPHLLHLMGASQSILAVGTSYTRILFGTNVVIMMLFVNNAIFRGAGDASLAMRALWLANGINLVLDPCLIFGLGPFPELGLTGAAVATSLGRGIGVCFQFWMLSRGSGRIVLARRRLRFRMDVMTRLVKLAGSGSAQWLVATASWVVLVRIVASFGGSAVAAYTLAIRIIMFALLPAFGVSNAAATLVGQNLGANNPRRAELSVWLTGLYTMVLLVGVTALFVSLGEPIIRLFTADPELVPVATTCLRVISYGYVFYAWGMVMVQAFNGAGDTTTPLFLNLACFWFCQIPLAWLLSQRTSLAMSGVFWAVAISESILAMLAMLVFRQGRWKSRQV